MKPAVSTISIPWNFPTFFVDARQTYWTLVSYSIGHHEEGIVRDVILIPRSREKNLRSRFGAIAAQGEGTEMLESWFHPSPRISHPLGGGNHPVDAASHFVAALRC
jgi:hypothetical protein